MKELSTNTNIVVMEADKGGAITIINTSDYITDCVLLLNDTKNASNNVIRNHWTDLERAGILYGLPKLH